MNNEINELVNEFSKYLNSEKFNCGNEMDNYINISGVHDMIDQIRDINNFGV